MVDSWKLTVGRWSSSVAVPRSLIVLVLLLLMALLVHAANLTAQIDSLTAQVAEQSRQVRKLNDQVQNKDMAGPHVFSNAFPSQEHGANIFSEGDQEVQKLNDQIQHMTERVRSFPSHIARFQMKLFADMGGSRKIGRKTSFVGGRKVAFHSHMCNGFLRMNDDFTVNTAGEMSLGQLPPYNQWPAERFSIVYAGEGQIAIHNKKFNRFLRLNQDGVVDTCCEKNIDALPDDWAFERFTLVVGDVDAVLQPISPSLPFYETRS